MKLFFRKEGSGEPLVIVHGLYGSSDNWLSVAKRLARHYTVYMPDQRNHGRSPQVGSHSYDDLKNDLAEFLDQQKLDQVNLLGHSMGGKVAMYFAADYPEKVKKLIVADIAPKDYMLLNEDSQYYLHRNILMAMQEIDFSVANTRKLVDSYLAEKIDEPRIRQFLLKNVEKDKPEKRLKWRVNAEVLYDYLDEIISGVNKHWLSDRIPITAYPVTFIKGEKSPYIQEDDKALIKEIYPEARIINIPNAGHWLHAEQTELFVKAVLSYQ